MKNKTALVDHTNHAGISKHITHASGNRKTVCTSAVLAYLGIAPQTYNYSSKIGQLKGVLGRNGLSYRSRLSRLPRECSVGASRALVGSLGDEVGTTYLVWVAGHVLLLNSTGSTLVDTDPRKRDRRKIIGIWAISRKG